MGSFQQLVSALDQGITEQFTAPPLNSLAINYPHDWALSSMESYPTSLAHVHDQHSKHLANHAPAGPGQTTPSHGGLVQGHKFDMPITLRSPATFPKVPESSNHFDAAVIETAPSKNGVPTLETVPQTP